MADSEAAATTLEGQPLNAGFLPVDPAPTSSPRPWFRIGRWGVGALGGAAILSLVVFAIAPTGEKQGTQITADVKATVELVSVQTFYADMLDKVNHERQRKGLPDLCYNAKLNKVAQLHSEDQARHNHMTHSGSDGSSAGDRIKKAGYTWNLYAENVAQGQTSVDEVMDSWMRSTGHKENILTDGISHFGLGWKDNFWTQVFASPSGPESCVLAGGGEDHHGGQCRDVKPGGKEWHDSDGGEYHCNWYAQGTRCREHGGNQKYANNGYVANQACCVCGGGCLDKTLPEGGEWYDSDGKQYHCDWYSQGDHCSEHGNGFRNHGMVAKEACCACGGGTDVADITGSSAPAAGTGKCCRETCASSSDCQQPNLFCCPYHKLCMDLSTKSTAGPNCQACSR